MEINDNIRAKFEELISSGNNLKRSLDGSVLSEEQGENCVGWLASAQNMVHLVVYNANNPYRISVDRICNTKRDIYIPELVGDLVAILKILLSDIDDGLLASIENQTSAYIYDNFLDSAKEYLKRDCKKEAGVIAGVVFEDTLRRIC